MAVTGLDPYRAPDRLDHAELSKLLELAEVVGFKARKIETVEERGAPPTVRLELIYQRPKQLPNAAAAEVTRRFCETKGWQINPHKDSGVA